MKKLLLLLSVFLMMSCGTFKISTMNYDPIYTTANGETIEVNVVDNEWELNKLLRDDFNFRYDFAQYAKSQPISFDWNNRILRNNRYNNFNRYNYNNRYSWSNGWNMNSYWNRDQMWDDWLWGYSSMNNGMGWSYSWNNNSWSSNYWNSPYGWNTYYGWNTGWNGEYGRRVRNNESHNVSRRTTTTRDRRAHAAMIQSTRTNKSRRTNIVIEKPLRRSTIKPIRRSNTTIRRNTTTPTKVYNRIPVNTNRRVNTNNTNRRRVTPPRTTTTRRTTTTTNRKPAKRGNE